MTRTNIKDKMYCLQRAVWRNGGSSPQKVQCEFGSYYPARTLVKPPLRQAAGRLEATKRSDSEIDKNKVLRILTPLQIWELGVQQ